MNDEDRLAATIEAIDRANAEDPNLLEVRLADGTVESGPKELVHARMMTRWLLRLDPEPDEAQQITARAHHFRRWTFPRSDYPEGRAGYLRWRAAARRRHAEQVAALLLQLGHPESLVADVQRILCKEGLESDPRVQTHEDALCLVFCQTQLRDVAGQLGQDHTVDVLVRSLDKMSDRGRAEAEALAAELGGQEQQLVDSAVREWQRRRGV